MNAEDLVALAFDSRTSILQPVEPYFPVAHGNVLLELDCERPCFHGFNVAECEHPAGSGRITVHTVVIS